MHANLKLLGDGDIMNLIFSPAISATIQLYQTQSHVQTVFNLCPTMILHTYYIPVNNKVNVDVRRLILVTTI